MEVDKKYRIDLSYIPDRGMLFVDACGIDFVGPEKNNSIEIFKQKVKRAENCLRLFRKRGNVVTMPGVLNEIKDRVDYSKNRKRMSKNRKTEFNSRGSRELKIPYRARAAMENQKRRLKVYRNLYDYLSEAFKKNDLGSPDEIREIHLIIQKLDWKNLLSSADTGLISGAVYSGDSSGILSADANLMSIYKKAVNHFSLDDCFISNVLHCKTEYL